MLLPGVHALHNQPSALESKSDGAVTPVGTGGKTLSQQTGERSPAGFEEVSCHVVGGPRGEDQRVASRS